MTFSRVAINTLTSSPICRLMQPLRRRVVPIFLLHRFTDEHRAIQGHTQEQLESALAYLGSHGYTVVSIRQVVEAITSQKPLPSRSVAFTLDDGFSDQAKMLPVFESYQAPVTMFLATDMLEKRHWSWDYKLEYIFRNTPFQSLELDLGTGLSTVNFSDPKDRRVLIRSLKKIHKQIPNDQAELAVAEFSRRLKVEVPEEAPEEYEPISWEQARTLESDFVEFGPHSKRHVILSQVSEQEAESEILGSWEAVKKNLANPLPVFCYPSGREGVDFGSREQQIVARAGFRAALSADPGYIDLATPSNNNLFSLKRFSFPNDITYFKQYCSWLEYAKECMAIA
ncbi:polysaccharide deacetylase family protein [Marinobacter szutsaonensis]